MDQLSAETDFLRFAARHLSVSHGQLAQDLWVLWLLGDKPGWFVEIGGFDGVTLSNTLLLEQLGWTGLLVEPLPEAYATLTEVRSCHALNCAIGAHAELRTVFRHVSDAPELSRLDNVVPDDLHTSAGARDRHELIETRTITISEALESADAPEVIDYVSLDTEGNELEILQTFPFDEHPVRCLTVEHNWADPRQGEIQTFLAGHGYKSIFPDVSRWDGWYAHAEIVDAAARPSLDLSRIGSRPPVALARHGQVHLGQSMLAHRLMLEAAEVVELVAESDPTHIPVHRLKISIAEAVGDADAIGQANRALALVAPQLPGPAMQAAAWHRKRNEPELGLDILNACTNPNAHVDAGRGRFLLQLGRLDEALAAFEQALRANPELPGALTGQADSLKRLGLPPVS